MLLLTIFLALTAAALNAVSTVVQRRQAGKPPPHELFRPGFIKGLLKDKVWIFAFGLQIAAFFSQAVALKLGSLIIVAPLLVTDLIVLLLILHFKYGLAAGVKEWSAVLLICVGLSGFLISANPKIGHQAFIAFNWALTVCSTLVVIAIAIYIVRRHSNPNLRAAIAGLAAGFSFALTAAFTKLTTRQLDHGLAAVFVHWPVYALLFSGILSLVMTQNTFGAGPLVYSQPAMEITEPVISIMFGIVLFGDSVNLGGLELVFELIAGSLALAGIWLMASSSNLYLTKQT